MKTLRILLALIAVLVVSQSASAIEVMRKQGTATYIVFPIIDSAKGEPVTGAAGLDSEFEEWDDGAAPTGGFVDCTNEATEIGTTGMYFISLVAAEVNQGYTIIQIKSSTAGALTQVILIKTFISDPVNMATTDDGGTINVASGAVEADMTLISGDAAAATALKVVAPKLDDVFDGTGEITMTLENIVVNNSSGVGMSITGSSSGMVLTGTSGSGLLASGSVYGIQGQGITDGGGLAFIGVGTGNGMLLQGGNSAGSIGLIINSGGADGAGVTIEGGATSGDGMLITGIGVDDAIKLIAAGAGDALNASAGSDGGGVDIRGDISGTITTALNLTTNNDKTGYALTIADWAVAGDAMTLPGDSLASLFAQFDSVEALQYDVLAIIESQRGEHAGTGNVYYVDPVNGATHGAGARGGKFDPYDNIEDCLANAVVSGNHDIIILVPGAAPGITTMSSAAAVVIDENYVFIRGPGRDFLWTRSTNGNTIEVTGDGVELSGFQLETNAAGSGDGINGSTSDFLNIHHVWINATYGDGIELDNCDNFQIKDNNFQNTGVSGSGHGIVITAGTGESSDYGVICRNHFDDVQGDGIRLSATGTGTLDATKIYLNGIQGATNWGINLVASGSNDAQVHHNFFGNNSSGNILDNGTTTILANNQQWATADSVHTAILDANKPNFRATGFAVASDLDSVNAAIADAGKLGRARDGADSVMNAILDANKINFKGAGGVWDAGTRDSMLAVVTDAGKLGRARDGADSVMNAILDVNKTNFKGAGGVWDSGTRDSMLASIADAGKLGRARDGADSVMNAIHDDNKVNFKGTGGVWTTGTRDSILNAILDANKPNFMADVSNLDVAVSSRSDFNKATDSVIVGVTAAHAPDGFLAALADSVWDGILTRDLTTPNDYKANVSALAIQTDMDSLTNAIADLNKPNFMADVSNLDVAVSSRSDFNKATDSVIVGVTAAHAPDGFLAALADSVWDGILTRDLTTPNDYKAAVDSINAAIADAGKLGRARDGADSVMNAIHDDNKVNFKGTGGVWTTGTRDSILNAILDANKPNFKDGIGTGNRSVFLLVKDASSDVAIQGVNITIEDATTALREGPITTGSDGKALALLDEDESYNVYLTHNNYDFVVTAITIGDALTDTTITITGDLFEPGNAPTANLVNTWGYIVDETNTAVTGVIIEVQLSGKRKVWYVPAGGGNPVAVSNAKRVDTTDGNGYWNMNLFPNDSLTPSNTHYLMKQIDSTGAIGEYKFIVPDSASGANWRFEGESLR